MLKPVLRAFIFTVISLRVTQFIINGFFFGGDSTKTFLTIAIALSLLYLLLRPVLSLLSFHDKGIGLTFLTFVMTTVVLYVLTLVLPFFAIRATELSNLIIFGFMLPSKSLTPLWSTVFSALITSITFNFFEWMCSKK